MAKGKTVVAPQVTPSKAKSPEEFMKRYQELCKEFGLNIAFEPRWTQSKDTGDYRLIIASGVVPLPKEE